MKIKEIFTLHQGNGFELYNMEESFDSEVNFVSRTAQNNGVSSQVCKDDKIAPFPAGFITVALGGSVLSSFVQLKQFYTAFHVMVLEPKKAMKFNEKLFYCMCIKANAYRYSYGRQANKTLGDIELPDIIPKWVYTTDIQPVSTKIKYKELSLDFSGWEEYEMGNLFEFVKGKRLTKEDMILGKINFLGAISENNGVREHIETDYTSEPNCITVNYNGSVGEAFYQSEPFWASDDVNILYAKNWAMNKFNALFLITIIRANRYRFGYGRKWTVEKMKETILKLPADDDGNPDWYYMGKYVESLPYSDKI
jgi:Type I restriction modification DNA specificity domain.